MGRKGDLLELIDGSPVGVDTLTGSVWKWTHHERMQRAFTEVTRARGPSVAVARFGRAVDETSDEHWRVWVDPPDRWRFESDDQLDLRDGATRWVGAASRITELDDDRTELEDTEIGMLISSGGRLLGSLRFGEPTDDEVAGRPCLRVAASVQGGRGKRHLSPLDVRIGGVDHTFWFDAATGITLRHVGIIDDEPCTVTEFKDVSINPPLSPTDFEFVRPPDAVVERQVDHLLRVAELQGIDLTGVDRDNLEAVRAAINEAMDRNGSPRPPRPGAQVEDRRAKHVPLGDPPSDEEAARAAIVHAFTHHDDIDGSGQDLVNVQCGRGLAGPLRQAEERIPGGPESVAAMVVDDVKFLRPDEAVVWFSIEIDGERFPMVDGREGRAVRVGDRWLIEHATIADLLGFAGVVVPAPEP